MNVACYVICLDRIVERRANVEAMRARVPGLHVQRAVDAALLKPKQHLVGNGTLADGAPLNTGQIACALSHYVAWGQIADREGQIDYAVVLEDDSVILDDTDGRPFVDAVVARLEAAGRPDVLYLHCFPGAAAEVCRGQSLGPGVFPAVRMWATWGYCVTPACARALQDGLLPLRGVVDGYLADRVTSGPGPGPRARGAICVPPLVSTHGDVGPAAQHRQRMRSTIWSAPVDNK